MCLSFSEVSTEEFDENGLLPELKRIPGFQLEKIAWRTILGKIEDVRFSIFYYEYPVIYPLKRYGEIGLIDARDIAVMKIAAIASRGVKRDFVDMYFICKEVLSLSESIRLYDKKYKNLSTTSFHIMKSLVYFDEAEGQEMPKMLKACRWEDVKGYFENEVKRSLKEI